MGSTNVLGRAGGGGGGGDRESTERGQKGGKEGRRREEGCGQAFEWLVGSGMTVDLGFQGVV